MAYVEPRGPARDFFAAVCLYGTRFVAIVSYAVAVTVAFVLLSPMLRSESSEATAVVPTGSQPVLYTVHPGDTPMAIASSQGISLARLFALNPGLMPLADADQKQVVVGLRP